MVQSTAVLYGSSKYVSRGCFRFPSHENVELTRLPLQRPRRRGPVRPLPPPPNGATDPLLTSPRARACRFIPFTWSVVGRSLVRDYAIRRLWGDVAGAAASRELAEHVLMFMASCSKSGLGISGESFLSSFSFICAVVRQS